VAETPAAVWLVLPTYDEAENVEAMVAAVRGVLPESRRVLVVDDNSPDGTGEIADRLAVEHADVEVLHRPRKEGLGPAYLAGFRRALAGGAELVLEMDCDFSHDPAYLPRMLDAARNADLVLGRSAAAAAPMPGSCWGSPYATSPAASSAFAARCWRRSISTRSTRAATPFRSR